MAIREWTNPPLFSTTASNQANPSTATLCAELIIPVTASTSFDNPGLYEIRFGLGGSTGLLWRLDCALSSGLGSTSLRPAINGGNQRINVFTGSNLSAEFVVTWQAAQGDRFRAVLESSVTASVAAWIQAERLT